MSAVAAEAKIAERPEWSVKTTREKRGWLRSVRYNHHDVLHYHYGPESISFDSPMVNASNLICNGGFRVREDSELIIDQLASGRKPFGQAAFRSNKINAWEKTEAEARQHEARLRDAGLVTKLSINTRETAIGPQRACWVTAAQNITVGEIGPLSQLQSDYAAVGLGHLIDIGACADLRLSDCVMGVWGFDYPSASHPESGGPFLTGLIGGYPVWATISLYQGGIDDPDDHAE